MSLGLNGTNQNKVDARYRLLRIVWLAILVSVIGLFFVTRVVEITPNNIQILFWILMAVGVATFGASFVLKYKLLKQATWKRNPGQVQIAYILAFALCEVTGIFGAIAYFVTGEQHYYFFFVLSSFGILLHKPQRDDVLAAYGGNDLLK